MSSIKSLLTAGLLMTALLTMAPNTAADPPIPPPPACNDGVDNDGNGKTDYPDDPGCSSSTDDSENSTMCNDRMDNDGDGKVDYPDDPGCDSPHDNSEKGPHDPCNDKGPRHSGWVQEGFFMWYNEQCGYDNCMDHGTPGVHASECLLGQSGVMPEKILVPIPEPIKDLCRGLPQPDQLPLPGVVRMRSTCGGLEGSGGAGWTKCTWSL